MNMQDNDKNQIDDSETDSELESDYNSNEARPSSKSLSSQLKDNKKTTSLPKKKRKQPTQAMLEQVMENIRPHGPNRQNKLQAACADLAEEEKVNEVDESTIKILYNRSE
ncbi:43820_t:CDS:2, partial [Gigaspora margarita]